MYYIYSIEYHKKNIRKLIETSAIGLSNYQNDYNKFISINSVFEKPMDLPLPLIANFQQAYAWCPKFFNKNKQFFGDNSTEVNHQLLNGVFDLYIEEFKTMDDNLYSFIILLMKIIVINNLTQYIEGTTNDALGLSLIDYKPYFQKEDFHELIFHQIVHKLVFIDNRNQNQLPKKYLNFLVDTDFKHKRGGNKFPLYIVYHSFILGIELLLYRKNFQTLEFNGNYHGTSQSIIEKSYRGYEILLKFKNLFTNHGQEILSRAYNSLQQFN